MGSRLGPIRLVVAWALCGALQPMAPWASAQSQPVVKVQQYGLLELACDPNAQYANPYDPAEVDVTAVFESPSGKKLSVPGFYAQEFESAKGQRLDLKPLGTAGWKVRFSPREIGLYRYTIGVADQAGSRELSRGEFKSVASPDPGFIRVQGRYFVFDSNEVYFPLGHNVAWMLTDPVESYRRYFEKMHEAQENCVRIWMADWTLGPENRWIGPAGKYDQARLWHAEKVMELARKDGLYVMLTLLACCDFKDHWNENSAYNAKFGGPCENSDAFFADPKAQELFQHRLRYLVARFGWDSHLLAWELFNEVDGIAGSKYQSKPIVAWHSRMAGYLRKIDPYDHPISTSCAWRQRDDDLWKLPELDFTQTHLYSAPEEYGKIHMAERIAEFSEPKVRRFGKPTIIGEFGAHPREGWKLAEDDGVCLHNGLWAGALSGGSGVPLYWYWDQVEKQNLWSHFSAVAAFLKDVDWLKEDFQPAEISLSSGDLWATGLRGKTICLLWVKHRKYTFCNYRDKVDYPPVQGADLTLKWPQLSACVEPWDTRTGEPQPAQTVLATEGKLVYRLPSVQTDIAIKIRCSPQGR